MNAVGNLNGFLQQRNIIVMSVGVGIKKRNKADIMYQVLIQVIQRLMDQKIINEVHGRELIKILKRDKRSK
jgi:hypothetical protein